MAYISQTEKKALSVGIKKVLKKYKVKGTLKIYHYSKLVLTLRSGVIDFSNDWKTQNPNTYWLEDQFKDNELAKNFLVEVKAAMNKSEDGTVENFDKSDIQSDYFHVGYYIDINVGEYNKPYKMVA